jgi:hypothetical protein
VNCQFNLKLLPPFWAQVRRELVLLEFIHNSSGNWMYSFTACQCQVQAGVQECGASQGCLQGCVWFVSNRIHISQYYHLIYICYIFYASKLQNGVYCVMIYGIVPPFVKAMSGSDVMWYFCLGIISWSQETRRHFYCYFYSVCFYVWFPQQALSQSMGEVKDRAKEKMAVGCSLCLLPSDGVHGRELLSKGTKVTGP